MAVDGVDRFGLTRSGKRLEFRGEKNPWEASLYLVKKLSWFLVV